MATKQYLGTRYRSFKNDGTVNASGWVYFYEVGTSTEKTTYSDSELTVPNASPVVFNSAGAADIWFEGDADAAEYDSTGTLIDSYPNLNPATTTSTVGYNLILNGSFEEGGTTTPSNWTRSTPPSGGTSVQDTDSAHGLYSWKFTSGGNGAGNLITTDFFNVAVDREFYVVWQMKSSVADVRNLVEVVWYDDADAELSASSLYDDSTTNPTSWTVKTALATPVASAVRAKLRLTGCHSSDATAGSTWFDGIQVTEVLAQISGNISFPATQVPSANANTLDDYEEGTWTPAVGGTATYTVQTGTYTKIGRLVHINCRLEINVLGTGSATTISGLPFTASATHVAPVIWSATAANYVTVIAQITSGATTVTFNAIAAAANTIVGGVGVMGNGTALYFTGSYSV